MDSPCPLIPQAGSLLFDTQGYVVFILGPQIASVKRPPPSGWSPLPSLLIIGDKGQGSRLASCGGSGTAHGTSSQVSAA